MSHNRATDSMQVEFDTEHAHRYQLDSLNKIWLEEDDSKTPLHSFAPVGTRVMHKKRGPGVVTKIVRVANTEQPATDTPPLKIHEVGLLAVRVYLCPDNESAGAAVDMATFYTGWNETKNRYHTWGDLLHQAQAMWKPPPEMALTLCNQQGSQMHLSRSVVLVPGEVLRYSPGIKAGLDTGTRAKKAKAAPIEDDIDRGKKRARPLR